VPRSPLLPSCAESAQLPCRAQVCPAFLPLHSRPPEQGPWHWQIAASAVVAAAVEAQSLARRLGTACAECAAPHVAFEGLESAAAVAP